MSSAPSARVKHFSGADVRPSRRVGRHADAVLAFHLAGELEVEQGGSFVLRAGDVRLIPPGEAHRITAARDVAMWCMGLQTTQLGRERFGDLLAPLDNVARGALARVSIPRGRHGFVVSLFEELAARRSDEPPVRTESLVALLLAEIGDHAPALGNVDSPRSDVTAQALAFIAAHALAPLSLSAVARAIGRDRSYVADVVRRDTGRSVGAWISEIRLEEARRRLEGTGELIAVIAERVGYADGTHFARSFKRRFGLAPRAWRRRAR